MNEELKIIISELKETGRYPRLLKKVTPRIDPSVLFEILFANFFEQKEMKLDYEIRISQITNHTVDFVYHENDDCRLCFELVSPGMSAQLKPAFAPRPTDIEGVSSFGTCLESNHPNEYFRPEAQTIRLQEKLLEKVEKFPQLTDSIFSSIVVDCSSFHCGQLDGEDCRMVMFGKTREPLLQERWHGTQLLGLLDERNNSRWAKEFRERIVSVIFVPNQKANLLDGAFVLLNYCLNNSYLNNFISQIRNNPAMRNLKYVPHPDLTP